jgi:hypothetical protein
MTISRVNPDLSCIVPGLHVALSPQEGAKIDLLFHSYTEIFVLTRPANSAMQLHP